MGTFLPGFMIKVMEQAIDSLVGWLIALLAREKFGMNEWMDGRMDGWKEGRLGRVSIQVFSVLFAWLIYTYLPTEYLVLHEQPT